MEFTANLVIQITPTSFIFIKTLYVFLPYAFSMNIIKNIRITFLTSFLLLRHLLFIIRTIFDKQIVRIIFSWKIIRKQQKDHGNNDPYRHQVQEKRRSSETC